MIDLIPKNVENLNKGLVELESYKNSDLNLEGWELTDVLDDILMVEYIDISSDGTQIKRGNIWVPVNVVNFAWRVGKVHLAGPNCQTVKKSDCVIFPNDKGIKVASLNNISNLVFLNEARIFGVAKPKNG
jgi:hypothetical protein